MLTIFKRLWAHISSKRRFELLGLMLLTLMTSLTEVISIGAVLPFLTALTNPSLIFENQNVQPLISFIGIKTSAELFLSIAIGFGVASFFAGIMRVLLIIAQTRISAGIGSDFGVEIYTRTLYQPYLVHVSRNSSELVAGITSKATSLIHGAISPCLLLLSSLFMLLIIVICLLIIDPIAATISIMGFTFIYYVIILASKERLRNYSEIMNRETGEIVRGIQEGLGGIRDIIIGSSQQSYINTFRRAYIGLQRSQANVQLLGAAPRYVVESFAMILLSIVALVTHSMTDGIQGTIPALGALALGAQRILPILQSIYTALTAIRGHKDSVSDALDLLDQPMPDCLINKSPPLNFKNSISLKNIYFKYTIDREYVLDGLNLLIPKGSRVGIVGETGSGKSTLIDVLMGLLLPTRGAIYIDEKEITPINQGAWQKNIAHVPQFIYLTDGSIAENIAFGIPVKKIDLMRVKEVAEIAKISTTIEAMPNQYDSIVGERGVRLSGGQRQRIGIARALYNRANLIILDEATSSLDNNTEKEVVDAIEGLSKELTILMVAHRTSTLKGCDFIVKMEAGSVKQIGSYEELYLGISK